MTLEEKMLWVVGRCKGEVSITFNEHKPNHENLLEHLGSDVEDMLPEVVDEIVKRDFLVTLRCYVHGSAGFWRVQHYDLSTSLDIVIEHLQLFEEKVC